MSALLDEFGCPIPTKAAADDAWSKISAIVGEHVSASMSRKFDGGKLLARIRSPRVVTEFGDGVSREAVGLPPVPPMDGGKSIMVPLSYAEKP